MVPPRVFHLLLSPPTTSQIVSPMVHRWGVFCDRCSAVLRQIAWGGDVCCFRPTHTRDGGELRVRAFDAWSCSINNPQRITAQHEEFSGSLKRLSLHISVPSLMAPF